MSFIMRARVINAEVSKKKDTVKKICNVELPQIKNLKGFSRRF